MTLNSSTIVKEYIKNNPPTVTALGGITSYTATTDCILCLQSYRSGAGISYQSHGTHTYKICINGEVVNTETWTGGSLAGGGGYMDIPAYTYFLNAGDTITISAVFSGQCQSSSGTQTVSNKDSLQSGTTTLIEF